MCGQSCRSQRQRHLTRLLLCHVTSIKIPWKSAKKYFVCDKMCGSVGVEQSERATEKNVAKYFFNGVPLFLGRGGVHILFASTLVLAVYLLALCSAFLITSASSKCYRKNCRLGKNKAPNIAIACLPRLPLSYPRRTWSTVRGKPLLPTNCMTACQVKST